VNGEGGSAAYRETDPPAAQDAYGISKHEAEVGLREIAAETGMAVVIIRPPLVYGPGVKANFRALLSAIAWGIPLPLRSIDNRRSMVAWITFWILLSLVSVSRLRPMKPFW